MCEENDLERGCAACAATEGPADDSEDAVAPAQSDTGVQPSNTKSSDLFALGKCSSTQFGCCSIEVLQIRSESLQWEATPIAEIGNPSILPESTPIRLFLVEGLAKEIISYFSDFDEDFFRLHHQNVLPYNRAKSDKNCFFAKWSRRVHQDPDAWHIEQKIAQGRPYDLDLVTDPDDIRLDHWRFERVSSVQRPCSYLEADLTATKGLMRQAVQDCISICYKRVDNGLIGKRLP